MHRDLPRLEKSELLSRLAAGHGARLTVVTPNRRLAQALQRDFDAARAGEGRVAWEAADILPFGAFLERLWHDALYSDLAAEIPVLLSAAQEDALWEDAVGARRPPDKGVSTPAAAEHCREAWRLAHAWRIELQPGPLSNDDSRAFLEWCAHYQRATREAGQTDPARLPDVLAPHLGHAGIRQPATLVLFGFDLLPPQSRDFLDALAARGCAMAIADSPACAAQATRLEFTEPRDEILAAARWARARLEAGGRRIGVVVPDLGHSRTRVQRLFADVLQPDHLVDGGRTLPFNVSLGAALSEFPLVADALLALELAGPACAFEHASRLIRSPFIAGGEAEMALRARLDACLRERCASSVSLEPLLRLASSGRYPQAPMLLDRLGRLARVRKASLFGAKNAAQWAKALSEALQAVGFPGDRTLDSTEQQTRDKWDELLAEFATLERVTGKMGYTEACRRLARMARETIFQPEARDLPIQVLGVLESAGLEFDHLWVMGLTDEAWPLPARPNPFIPARLQRAAGVPQADPVSSLEFDRRITEGWLRAAPEVVVSPARMTDETELAPSPLVAAVAPGRLEELAIAAYATLRESIRAAGTREGALEVIDDARAPPLDAGTPIQRGGTALFREQAACPFRAFSHRRLRTERELESPRPGLDARSRGNLVHEMLKTLWTMLESRERLAALAAMPAELTRTLEAAADAAIVEVNRQRPESVSGRFGALERERLVRMGREWLRTELQREDFEVVSLEKKEALTFGGITVSVKLDRMDRLANGSYAVIDYKTGNCAVSSWLGARPEEPQLPMYALSTKNVAAVAFAQVKTGVMKFHGVSREPDLLPNVKVITDNRSRNAKLYRDWAQLVEGWRGELESIGAAFVAGDARVDPKNGKTTCELCDQKMVCRIAEKADFGAIGEGEPDE
jgi:probable DNA repair protein